MGWFFDGWGCGNLRGGGVMWIEFVKCKEYSELMLLLLLLIVVGFIVLVVVVIFVLFGINLLIGFYKFFIELFV